ncbi:thioredoxin domain-containing protein [Oceanotoga sp. DSM 15011]|uniref:thioredoxin domain-containing protein n=1 Tax=Oceanotoga sp. DSM 15011 TaxID=2984951 RepID=UPI0021F4346C|nr:thioredoxin domain-containing protein [Oceanotoga sp. DSM 15011]UYP01157.1 thioredoxin domain-containing protein [Oceanotoga sp. DSM 15011]
MIEPNNLIKEKSPYLLQHAFNPINWYPWCDEAFERALKEDKPIFLSIGYSTCHWCHFMAKESFEDEDIAKILNKYYISIKVDREERPDIDSYYMKISQIMTGNSGWPLNIIMTPDKRPFYSGTYFPKFTNFNMPGLIDLLPNIYYIYKDSKEDIFNTIENLEEKVKNSYHLKKGKLDSNLIDKSYKYLYDNFDEVYGGFSNEPKFPVPHYMLFLMSYYEKNYNENALYMVEKTVESMYRGGIFDHIEGGFSRYSTDYKWFIPHFEKTLIDNSLLILTLAELYSKTNDDLYKNIAYKTLKYINNNLKDENGAFYCAQDSDSEGEEGKYYLWDYLELKTIFEPEEFERFKEIFDVSKDGNFQGKNILNISKSLKSIPDEDLVFKLFYYKSENRKKPDIDDKIITSWNGVAIASLAKAGRLFNDIELTKMAEKSNNFIYKKLFFDNKLFRRYREEDILTKSHISDYSNMIWGLLELYQSTFKTRYLKSAINLLEKSIEIFYDKNINIFLDSEIDNNELPENTFNIYDDSMPSSNSVMLMNLIRVYKITGTLKYKNIFDSMMGSLALNFEENYPAMIHSLNALFFSLSDTKEIIITAKNYDQARIFIDYINRNLKNYDTIILKTEKNEIDQISEYSALYPVEDKPVIYICSNQTCNKPIKNLKELRNFYN